MPIEPAGLNLPSEPLKRLASSETSKLTQRYKAFIYKGFATDDMAQADSPALLKRLAADEKRAEAKAWLMERRHNDALHLARAHSFRNSVESSRQNARKAQADSLSRRKVEAMKERANDSLVDQEKARILASNKELVAYTYRSKFATSKEAEEWGMSTLLQFRSDYFGRSPDAQEGSQMGSQMGLLEGGSGIHGPPQAIQ